MRYLFICLLTFSLLSSCSGDQDKKEEESSIDRATKDVADKIVDHIKTPIEKAEAVKDIEEERTEQYKKQVQ